MQQINHQQTADGYMDALTIVDPRADTLTLIVANASVVAQFKPRREDEQEADWGPEQPLLPQDKEYPDVAGFRCRSALAGVPAVIVAALTLPGEPHGSGSPFTGYVAPSGAVGSTLQMQTGDILYSAINAARPGTVACDGAHYNSVADPTFQNLYNVIGISFGGSGPADFAVPDLRDRVPVGAGGNTPLAANEGVAAANRHATLHRHSVKNAAGALRTLLAFISGGATGIGMTNTGNTVEEDAGIGHDITNDPLDGPAYLGLSAFIVK